MEKRMISYTCTPNKKNYEELGMVTSEVVRGMGLWTTICFMFANFFGTRCKHLEKKINQARTIALDCLKEKATKLGGDALIEVKFDLHSTTVMAYATVIKYID